MLKLSLLIFYFLLQVGFANDLDINIDKDKILLDTDFSGDKIIILGAKEEKDEVIIVFKSKKVHFKVYGKEKFLGTWQNSKPYILKNIYKTYKIYTQQNSILAKDDIFRDLEIGLLNIDFDDFASLSGDMNRKMPAEIFLKHRMEEGNFEENYGAILTSLDLKSFILTLNVPVNIKAGDYLLEVFLIQNGNVKNFAIFNVSVKQAGFLLKIKEISEHKKLFYSIIALFISFFISAISFYIAKLLYYNKQG